MVYVQAALLANPALVSEEPDEERPAVGDSIRIFDVWIGSLGVRAIEPLKAIIDSCVPTGDEGSTLWRRCNAAFILLNPVGTPALPTFIDYLSHPDAGVRANAACLVGYMLDYLSNTDPRVPTNAAYPLGDLEATSVVDPLLRVLRTDVDHRVRRMAVDTVATIGRLGERRAIDALIQTVREEAEAEVRFAAADALMRVQAPEAIPTLVDLIASGAWRRNRFYILGPSIVAPLSALLLDRTRDPDLRYWTATVLRGVDDPRVPPLLLGVVRATDDGAGVRIAALSSLRKWIESKEVGTAMRALVTDAAETPSVREHALRMLSDAGATDLIPLAQSWLTDPTAPSLLRSAAAYALVRLDPHESRALIVAHLDLVHDDGWRAEIERVLAQGVPSPTSTPDRSQ